jgi:Flp pilus assembly protein TadD
MPPYPPGRALLLFSATLLLTACQMDQGGLQPLYQGIKPPPGTPQVHKAVDGLVVGRRLMAAGQYELALRAYYRAASEDGISPEILTAMGAANIRLGRLNQAEQVLRQALKLNPSFIPALNNLGVVLMAQGKYPEARLVFRNAFALDSGKSNEIRENLRLAIAKSQKSAYHPPRKDNKYSLVRQGHGKYQLLPTQKSAGSPRQEQ